MLCYVFHVYRIMNFVPIKIENIEKIEKSTDYNIFLLPYLSLTPEK